MAFLFLQKFRKCKHLQIGGKENEREIEIILAKLDNILGGILLSKTTLN